jgi:NAD(P)-dependent dehydrogenase (short-subunit alcohol dehydrogenase family)
VKDISLTGKIAIVTGGNVAIGLSTTKALLSAGSTVIVPVRTPEKAAENLAGLNVETPPLDLFDPVSIDNFAAAFIASGRPLLRGSCGYESQFSTNHLGDCQLTARL